MKSEFKAIKDIIPAVIGLFLAAVPVAYRAFDLAHTHPWPGHLRDLGRLCTLLAFVRLCFECVLSARVKWIERGIGLDWLLEPHTGKAHRHGQRAFCPPSKAFPFSQGFS